MKRFTLMATLSLVLLASLAACVSAPTGPTVAVMPREGKPFDLFQQEDLYCRNFAANSVRDTSDAALKEGATSAAVGADYRLSTVALHDGRVLNGIIASQTEKIVTLQTAKDRLTISRSEIDEIVPSSLSLMPDGLLQPLSAEQIRDLVAYLMSPTQVPLPPESP